MADIDVDILIIGGGLTGALLAMALANSPYKTLLVDAHPFEVKTTDDFDARSIALSPSSKSTLKTLGVWDEISPHASPINRSHISEQGQFGLSNLHPQSEEVLGYVVEVQALFQAIQPRLKNQDVLAPATLKHYDKVQRIATVESSNKLQSIQAKLVVAADGTHSKMRDWVGLKAEHKSYEQIAVVANLELSRAHQGVAFERFTKHGALALLPMTNRRCAMIWSMPKAKAQIFQAMSSDDFIKSIYHVFGYRLGRFNQLGKRSQFPLTQVIMKQQVLDRCVFIGNAAHTLHPVAGQGFNLGLRDVAFLAESLVKGGLSAETLRTYQAQRQHDQQAITRFTNALIEGFSNKTALMSALRGVGLLTFDNLIFLKKTLIRYAGGFGGVIPDLVCEVPLSSETFHE